MLTPKENIIQLFVNEKCKNCKNALWLSVKPFYYVTADGVKHRENKAALCLKKAKKSREKCEIKYSVDCGNCDGND